MLLHVLSSTPVNYTERLKSLDLVQISADLERPINAYFDNVFVMAEDERIRKNRLAMLQQLASLTDGIMDLSCLPGY